MAAPTSRTFAVGNILVCCGRFGGDSCHWGVLFPSSVAEPTVTCHLSALPAVQLRVGHSFHLMSVFRQNSCRETSGMPVWCEQCSTPALPHAAGLKHCSQECQV